MTARGASPRGEVPAAGLSSYLEPHWDWATLPAVILDYPPTESEWESVVVLKGVLQARGARVLDVALLLVGARGLSGTLARPGRPLAPATTSTIGPILLLVTFESAVVLTLPARPGRRALASGRGPAWPGREGISSGSEVPAAGLTTHGPWRVGAHRRASARQRARV